MILLLYATLLILPFGWGFLPVIREKPVPDRVRGLRRVSSLLFLGALGARIAAPRLFDLAYALEVALGRPFAMVPALALTVLDLLLTYALAVLIPGQFFSRRWRGTTASALSMVGRGLGQMMGMLLTWIALYLSVDLIGLAVDQWWLNGVLRLIAAWLILSASAGLTYLVVRYARHPENITDSMIGVVDLVQGLAARAGVRVRRVLFLETGDTRVANAYAIGGRYGFIGITTYLLDHFDREQIEFVAAHELGHLKMHHTLIRRLVSAVALTVAVTLMDQVGYSAADATAGLAAFILRLSIIIATVQLIPYAIYRKQELQADAFATRLTGNPEAAEESLRALETLNDIRLRERDQTGSTHPTTARRIEAITGTAAAADVASAKMRRWRFLALVLMIAAVATIAVNLFERPNRINAQDVQSILDTLDNLEVETSEDRLGVDWSTLTPEEVQSLIDDGFDVSQRVEPDTTPLMSAIMHTENADVIRVLVQNGADVSARDGFDDSTPLMFAANANPNPAIIQILIDNGADVGARDRHGLTALMSAADRNTAEVVQTLIDNGADVSARTESGTTALMLAARRNTPEVAQILIDNGADVLARSDAGGTALSGAAQREDSPEVAQILIDNGADVSARSDDGYTPLMIAARAIQNVEIVQTLIDNGAEVSARSDDGWSPLLIAARQSQNAEIVQILIDNGADVSARSDDGWTPLMLAARASQNVEIVQILIDNGADVSARSDDGWTPLMLAEERYNPNRAITRVLRSNGARRTGD